MATLISHTLRWAVGLVFLYAGAVKVTGTQEFAYAIQNYQITAWSTSIAIAVYLPWLEIVAALALLSRRFYTGALAILAGLNVGFIGALGSAWSRGLDISCGCFGAEINHADYPRHLAGDAAMLLVLGALAWRQWRAETRLAARLSP